MNKTAPLVVLVHGRGGNVDVMRLFLRAAPEDASILFVQAPEKELDEQVGGYSWWQVGRKTEAPARAKELLVFITDFIKERKLVPEKIIGIGFSQGGALLSVCFQQEPYLFDKVALLASFALSQETEKLSSKPATKVMMIHGAEDKVVEVNKALESLQQVQSKGFATESYIEPGIGHKIGINGFKVLKQWLSN